MQPRAWWPPLQPSRVRSTATFAGHKQAQRQPAHHRRAGAVHCRVYRSRRSRRGWENSPANACRPRARRCTCYPCILHPRRRSHRLALRTLVYAADATRCCWGDRRVVVRLEYELHTREPEVPNLPAPFNIRRAPCIFRRRQAQTPGHARACGERRVSLTFEYVTDPRIACGGRLISNMKDAVAYFGLRQVFGARRKRSASPSRSDAT